MSARLQHLSTLKTACSVMVITLAVPSVALAQAIIDGGTATTITTNPGGHQTVSIAQPNSSGVSLNTYTQFSVGAAGLDLDNRTAVATTIVNEVTSSRISELNGRLEVLGARAHVIIANPNGISVDGGSFENVGGVVLATGRSSIVSHQIAPGTISQNVVLDTAEGRIDVSGLGLSGAMTTLQLYAGSIRIDGPVTNNSENSRSDIRLVAGSSRVEFDSRVLPSSDVENWGTRHAVTTTPDASVAVEITQRGSLKANTVRIETTAQGAGVSHAGNTYASLGDFSLDSSGRISVTGSVKAFRNATVTGSEIEVRSNPGQTQTKLEAVNGALTLLASTGDIVNTGALLSGSQRAATNTASKGGVTLQAAGSVRLLTESAEQLAIVFSSQDDLDVQAGGNIENNTGRLLSNAKTSLVAGGAIENTVDVLPGSDGIREWTSTTQGKRLWYTLWQKRETVLKKEIDYGRERLVGQQAYIVGSNVHLVAGADLINRGVINANDGGVEIAADRVTIETLKTGSLDYTRVCRLTCTAFGTSAIGTTGGQINATKDVSVVAATSIMNQGQIVGYGDIHLSAPKVSIEGVRTATVFTRPGGVYNFWSGPYAWIGEGDSGGLVSAPLGSLHIDAFEPVKLKAGVLSARNGTAVPNGIMEMVAPQTGVKLWQSPIGLFRPFVPGESR
ncbi:filamentous hemagglutinin N-terminal domain-containing protein [Agrobacterium sp. Azo12]|uniref:filamentous hemagglutinin N-terminal domain-containing protein n=1 Tax=Agrobacterium sp. Azo12 TaxID=3031129 RepID=UPI0023D7DFA0|nr:filamentous hemagglutinin N-terminal domain-containing protein [Agrobacterium sp. Azo12]MDO5897881.1 filamentous hemagglutinin N-terminal domain-containing protein [Agrobacterium sp. Azo12]